MTKRIRRKNTSFTRKIRGGVFKPVNMSYSSALGSNLSEFPTDIPENTKKLSLSENNITEIPPEIGKFTNLRVLILSSNKLKTLPPEIGKLTNLEMLYLDQNKITELPPEIGNLVNLRQLYLERNKLTKLPPDIGKLRNLQILNLSSNQLISLPSEIGDLSKLASLNVTDNKLTTIPVSFVKLIKKDHSISYSFFNNPYVWLHPEIVKNFPNGYVLNSKVTIPGWYDETTIKIMEHSPDYIKNIMMDNVYNNKGEPVLSLFKPSSNESKKNDKIEKILLAPVKPTRKGQKYLSSQNLNFKTRKVIPPIKPNPRLEELPQDLENQVFSFLTKEDMAKFSQANKRTYDILRDRKIGGKGKGKRKNIRKNSRRRVR